MGVLKKHLCFLPGLPFGCQLGRWTLPQTEMQTLATCVRRLARLLWTLHLTFQEVSLPHVTLTSSRNETAFEVAKYITFLSHADLSALPCLYGLCTSPAHHQSAFVYDPSSCTVHAHQPPLTLSPKPQAGSNQPVDIHKLHCSLYPFVACCKH